MINQIFTGTPTSYRFAKCPTTVKGGDPVLLGTIPAVALNAYSSLTGGAVFYFNGTFALTVIGQSAESPVTTHKISPGDDLYATGTLDSATVAAWKALGLAAVVRFRGAVEFERIAAPLECARLCDRSD